MSHSIPLIPPPRAPRPRRAASTRLPWRLTPSFAALVLGACALLWTAAPLHAQDPLEVMRVVLSHSQMDPGQPLLVQVMLRNPTGRTARAGLRVQLLRDRNRAVSPAQTRGISVPAGMEQRENFRFEGPGNPGNYDVRFEVLTPDYAEPLLTGKPVFYAKFTVGQPPPAVAAAPPAGAAGAQGAAARNVPNFNLPQGLQFEKADLLWEDFEVRPRTLLLGQPATVKAGLRNVGGDIARNFVITVSYFNTRLPNRLETVFTQTVPVLAPGERLDVEKELLFPDDVLLGDYRIALLADEAGVVPEDNRENNQLRSNAVLQISTIRPTFPEAGYQFEEAGLFLFRWDSVRFTEFKVQVGTEETFDNSENFFDIPQGDKWVQDKEIVPLEGELPDMAVGLMLKNNANVLFWRVLGRNPETNKTGFSQAIPFTLQTSATPAGAEGSAAQQPAPQQQSGPRQVQ